MRILIACASTDGQTRKIARFAADHLNDRGASVEVLDLRDTEGTYLTWHAAALLVASLHVGGF